MRNIFNLGTAFGIVFSAVVLFMTHLSSTSDLIAIIGAAIGVFLVGYHFFNPERIDVVKYLDSFLDQKIKEAKKLAVLSDERTFKGSKSDVKKLIKNLNYHTRLQNEIYTLEIRTEKILLIAFKPSFLDEYKNRDFFKRDHLGTFNFQPGLDNYIGHLKRLKKISIYSLTETYLEHPTSIDKYDEQKWYKNFARELNITWLFFKFKTLDLISGKTK
jgi:hypothetical protein